MKILFVIPFFLLLTTNLYAQVGIGTNNPQEMLHVEGTLRVETTNQPTITTTVLTGIDNNGTIREVVVGDDLDLTDNTLSRRNSLDDSFGAITLNTSSANNIDLLLDAGEANENKTIIRIFNTAGTLELTGIKDGYDGQHIWLYPQSGELKLLFNDTGSFGGNRFETNTRKGCNQYEMIELIYDGTTNKWVSMYHHG